MTELTLQRLKATGWTPDRKVDITPIEEAYAEEGAHIPEKLREFFAEYAFLDIEYYDSVRDVHEEHNINPLDESWGWDRQTFDNLLEQVGVSGTAYYVGAAFRRNMDIFYHDDGFFYFFMGGGPIIRIGSTIDEFVSALCGDYSQTAGWEYLRRG